MFALTHSRALSVPLILSLPLLILSLTGLTLLLASCGEVEKVQTASLNAEPGTPQRYSASEFTEVIEPLLMGLKCVPCHTTPKGGFKWDEAGTPAASDSNQLNVQRAMNEDRPESSPMLVRLTPPDSNHKLYYCPQSCLYKYLLAWGSESDGPVDYDAIDCVDVSLEDVRAGMCPSE